MFKTEDRLKKENYLTVSQLPCISNVFERLVYKQINNYVGNKLWRFKTRFWKSYGTQHSPITMLSKWKNSLDQGEFVSVILMYLLETFHTINHGLLLAKIICVYLLRQSITRYVWLPKRPLTNCSNKLQLWFRKNADQCSPRVY